MSRSAVRPVEAKDLSIAIPCFNEEGTIGKVLDELERAFPEAELLVVDDGCDDRTRAVVLEHPRARLFEHHDNRGYGAAIRTACRNASREYIVWFDADGQHCPEMIRTLAQDLPYCDCVIGARTAQPNAPWLRRLGTFCLCWFARLLTQSRIPDLNSGLRAFRVALLKRYLHLLPDGYSASTTTTILMLELGYRIHWTVVPRLARSGTSRVRIVRDGLRTLKLILHLVILFSPLKFFLPLSLGLMAVGMAYGGLRAWIGDHGVPTSATVAVLMGMQAFLFGLLADQISAMRKEHYQEMRDEPAGKVREEMGTGAAPDDVCPPPPKRED